jgi:hypothetical protein
MRRGLLNTGVILTVVRLIATITGITTPITPTIIIIAITTGCRSRSRNAATFSHALAISSKVTFDARMDAEGSANALRQE